MVKCSDSKQTQVPKMMVHLCYPTILGHVWKGLGQYSRKRSTFNSCVLNSFCFSFALMEQQKLARAILWLSVRNISCDLFLRNPVNCFNSMISIPTPHTLYCLIIYIHTFSSFSCIHRSTLRISNILATSIDLTTLRNWERKTRMRRNSLYIAAFVLVLLCVPIIISARHINRSRSRNSQILNFSGHQKSIIGFGRDN